MTHYSEPLQLVHREVGVPVDVAEDLSGLDAQAQQRAMQAWVERAKFTQFIPEQPPLLRFTVHPCGPSAFQFSVIEHHVVLDGWSDMRMLEEVVAHYRARLARQQLWLPEIGSTYRDFVAAERQAIANVQSREFWTSRLRGAEPTILASRASGSQGSVNRRFDVPIPASRPSGCASWHGGRGCRSRRC